MRQLNERVFLPIDQSPNKMKKSIDVATCVAIMSDRLREDMGPNDQRLKMQLIGLHCHLRQRLALGQHFFSELMTMQRIESETMVMKR
jgi:hypothetical protein